MKEFFKKLFIFFLLLSIILPFGAKEVKAENTRIVKIGYYEDHNFQVGAAEDLAKSGYSFEYLQRLQMYTNWTYEYVYGDFGELYNSLVNGEIDILTGLAYKEEREEVLSYPDLAMGNTLYTFIKKGYRNDINNNPASLNGKSIGVLEGVMYSSVANYLKANGVNAKLVPFKEMPDRDQAIRDDKVDIIMLEGSATSMIEDSVAFLEMGDNDYFACVAKDKPEILKELNEAQAKLFNAYPNIKNELYNKWFRANVQSTALTENDKKWVEEHQSITVGYYNNYLPYSDTDSEGNVTGIIKDVIPEMFNVLNVQDIEINYHGYDTYDEMLEDLHNEKLDFFFPAFSEYWTAEKFDIMPSDELIATYYNLIYKGDYPDMDNATMSLRSSNKLVYAYKTLKFPNSDVKYYDTVQGCLNAVANGEVDATLINGLRTSSFISSNTKYKPLKVAQVTSNVALGFGTRRNESATVEFLNHAISLLEPDYALTKAYLYEEKPSISTIEFIRQNWWVVGVPFVVVVSTIILAVVIELRKSKKYLAQEEEQNKALGEKLQEISLLNSALVEAKQNADAANKAKTTFLNHMSHDIRTPMNAIIGYTIIALKQVEQDSVKDCLSKIEESSDHLLTLINDVLDISRIESGRVEYKPVPVDIRTVTDTVISIAEGFMKNRDLEFKINRCELKKPYVLADGVRIRDVLVNIISNAIKFTNDGGRISFEAYCEPIDENHIGVTYTVSDTGIGMSEDFVEHVFEEFAQEDGGARTKYKGTGLGMAITKKYVEMMGGIISVSSKKGEGSVFKVYLPFELSSEDKVQTKEHYVVSKDLNGVKVLLVEDNELNAEIAKTLLEEVGVNITYAEDGKKAIETFENNPADTFDVILMDIMMPNMNGYEATKAIRNLDNRPDGKTIPIIAMTANAFAEDVQQSIEAGMDGHIAKPLVVDEVLKTISRIIK
ncbi:MAG: transporter substrate-binding domain-containing protein [Erysipelotrichaceae bacterium]|nr:transporter substrate-binding domain-containing protein [Erysipelotrichaceae bacterium]